MKKTKVLQTFGKGKDFYPAGQPKKPINSRILDKKI